jgi:hypothetical protein
MKYQTKEKVKIIPQGKSAVKLEEESKPLSA